MKIGRALVDTGMLQVVSSEYQHFRDDPNIILIPGQVNTRPFVQTDQFMHTWLCVTEEGQHRQVTKSLSLLDRAISDLFSFL